MKDSAERIKRDGNSFTPAGSGAENEGQYAARVGVAVVGQRDGGGERGEREGERGDSE